MATDAHDTWLGKVQRKDRKHWNPNYFFVGEISILQMIRCQLLMTQTYTNARTCQPHEMRFRSVFFSVAHQPQAKNVVNFRSNEARKKKRKSFGENSTSNAHAVTNKLSFDIAEWWAHTTEISYQMIYECDEMKRKKKYLFFVQSSWVTSFDWDSFFSCLSLRWRYRSVAAVHFASMTCDEPRFDFVLILFENIFFTFDEIDIFERKIETIFRFCNSKWRRLQFAARKSQFSNNDRRIIHKFQWKMKPFFVASFDVSKVVICLSLGPLNLKWHIQ